MKAGVHVATATFAAMLGTTTCFQAGCLIEGMRYTDPMNGVAPTNAANATACQNLCEKHAGCLGFTYYPNSGACYFSTTGAGAKLTPTSGSVGDPMAYSGPPVCADPSPACPAKITATVWPADNVEDSMAAFNIGYQPVKNQCWPMTASDGSKGNCDDISTLDDTDLGWPGRCLGMTKFTLQDNQSCEEACLADVYCPGYQVGSDESCWHGLGRGCFNAARWNESWTPVKAKRFQRGKIHVLKKLVNVQVEGLQNVFDKATYDKMSDPASQCRKACYAVFGCQYWQLNNETGCWVELPYVTKVQYPLTTAGLLDHTTLAPNFVDGEFIQHSCLALPVIPSITPTTTQSTTTTTTTTEVAGGFPWWAWLLVALGLILICAALAAMMLCARKPAKTKKRAAKLHKTTPLVDPRSPGASVPLVQAQPVPTVQTAAPVYTVFAPAQLFTAPPPAMRTMVAQPVVTQQPFAGAPPYA